MFPSLKCINNFSLKSDAVWMLNNYFNGNESLISLINEIKISYA